MPVTEKSELIFITAMMILIVILSIAAVYIFFRTYKKEMREKEERKNAETRPLGSVPDVGDPKSEISNLRFARGKSKNAASEYS